MNAIPVDVHLEVGNARLEQGREEFVRPDGVCRIARAGAGDEGRGVLRGTADFGSRANDVGADATRPDSASATADSNGRRTLGMRRIIEGNEANRRTGESANAREPADYQSGCSTASSDERTSAMTT